MTPIEYYKKRPIEVKAFKLQKGMEFPGWFLEAFNMGENEVGGAWWAEDKKHHSLYIMTLEGVFHVKVGDYIIQGIKGEIYPCAPDIFKETYDRVY